MTPGGAHTKARSAVVFGQARFLQNFAHGHQALWLNTGAVAPALGTIRAVFGACPGLDAQEGAELDRIRGMKLPVDRLSPVEQVEERQRVEFFRCCKRSLCPSHGDRSTARERRCHALGDVSKHREGHASGEEAQMRVFTPFRVRRR
ncbi:MAG: hypothetical protein ACI9KE_005790 [Polyangiales bacterium]